MHLSYYKYIYFFLFNSSFIKRLDFLIIQMTKKNKNQAKYLYKFVLFIEFWSFVVVIMHWKYVGNFGIRVMQVPTNGKD